MALNDSNELLAFAATDGCSKAAALTVSRVLIELRVYDFTNHILNIRVEIKYILVVISPDDGDILRCRPDHCIQSPRGRGRHGSF